MHSFEEISNVALVTLYRMSIRNHDLSARRCRMELSSRGKEPSLDTEQADGSKLDSALAQATDRASVGRGKRATRGVGHDIALKSRQWALRVLYECHMFCTFAYEVRQPTRARKIESIVTQHIFVHSRLVCRGSKRANARALSK